MKQAETSLQPEYSITDRIAACLASGRERFAKPDDIVRQLLIRRLIGDYGSRADRIASESEDLVYAGPPARWGEVAA